ncbi:hypothetical protein [Arthrobacter sp. QXT-31]|uniref:hypothetical protein n=1 Tax=Arthrobacter sp. QXT-31 TaxID=1357915 RepID=UPI0012F9367A|nr:hypothetical protein [Arthrobacter sp. QXT-31]
METHRAEELEAYVQARLADVVDKYKSTLAGLRIMVADELELHDAPLHIQTNVEQIIVEGWVDLGLPEAERPEAPNPLPPAQSPPRVCC